MKYITMKNSAWCNEAWFTQASRRYNYPSKQSFDRIGFRLVGVKK